MSKSLGTTTYDKFDEETNDTSNQSTELPTPETLSITSLTSRPINGSPNRNNTATSRNKKHQVGL